MYILDLGIRGEYGMKATKSNYCKQHYKATKIDNDLVKELLIYKNLKLWISIEVFNYEHI